MIWAFTGKTGSGKTFRMVNEAYKRWCRGVDVYSNTVLSFEKVRPPIFGLILKVLKIKKLKRGRIRYFEDITEVLDVKKGLILFDEAQVLFNARRWESLPGEFQYKLQEHRKHELDLYCTTQNLGTIDISYRRLIQFWFHCEVLFRIGTKARSLAGLYRLNIKDIDQIYNTVDDLKADTIKKHFFIIHFFSRCLYDTMYDIGFKRFRTIWLTSYDEKMKKRQTYLILPKEILLKDALRDIRLYNSLLNPNLLQNSRRN